MPPTRTGARNTYHCKNKGKGCCPNICPQFWQLDDALYCSWCLPTTSGARSVSVGDWARHLASKPPTGSAKRKAYIPKRREPAVDGYVRITKLPNLMAKFKRDGHL